MDVIEEETPEEPGTHGLRGPSKAPWWRRVAAWVLVALACLLAVVSVVVVFARNQLLNTDAYVGTMAPLASDPAIQTQVATRVSDELIARIDLNQRVKDALPTRAGFLATPITSQVQNVTYSTTLTFVQSPQFEQIWIFVNRVAHKQLVAVLTGSSEGSISTKDGKITIDLSAVEFDVRQKLDAKGITVFDKVPAVKGLNYVLFQSKDLARIQGLVNFLNKLAVLLPIITLLLFAGAVVSTPDRRKGLVRAATGLALSMALLLVLIAVGRNQYIIGLRSPQSPAAATAVIDIVTANLRAAIRIILLVAALVGIGALIAGNSVARRKVNDMRKPAWVTSGSVHSFVVLHRKALQWSFLVLGLLILVIWGNPTTLAAVVVVLITLTLVGLVGLFARVGLNPAPIVSGGTNATSSAKAIGEE